MLVNNFQPCAGDDQRPTENECVVQDEETQRVFDLTPLRDHDEWVIITPHSVCAFYSSLQMVLLTPRLFGRKARCPSILIV